MENVIYENGENFLIKKKFAEQFLKEICRTIFKWVLGKYIGK